MAMILQYKNKATGISNRLSMPWLIPNYCKTLLYSLELNITIIHYIAEMKNALDLIPAILNHLLIKVLSKWKKNIFSYILFPLRCTEDLLSYIFYLPYLIKVFTVVELPLLLYEYVTTGSLIEMTGDIL